MSVRDLPRRVFMQSSCPLGHLRGTGPRSHHPWFRNVKVTLVLLLKTLRRDSRCSVPQRGTEPLVRGAWTYRPPTRGPGETGPIRATLHSWNGVRGGPFVSRQTVNESFGKGGEKGHYTV